MTQTAFAPETVITNGNRPWRVDAQAGDALVATPIDSVWREADKRLPAAVTTTQREANIAATSGHMGAHPMVWLDHISGSQSTESFPHPPSSGSRNGVLAYAPSWMRYMRTCAA